MFKRIYLKYAKWRQRDFLKWRDYISDFEKDFLLPELKLRCEALLSYFELINEYCSDRVDDKAFGASLRTLMLPKHLEKQVSPQMHPPTDEVLAEKYLSELKAMNNESFVNPLKEIIKEFDEPTDLKRLGIILNKINLVCATVVQIKEKLFAWQLVGFTTVHDPVTNQLVLAEPREYKVMLAPFHTTIENIFCVANSTSGTIHQWYKEQMQWKSEYLRVLSERLAQRNSLLAIFVAVAISWFFLVTSNPYHKLMREREIAKLGDKIVELKKQTVAYEQQLGVQADKIKIQTKQIAKLTGGTLKGKPTSPQSKY